MTNHGRRHEKGERPSQNKFAPRMQYDISFSNNVYADIAKDKREIYLNKKWIDNVELEKGESISMSYACNSADFIAYGVSYRWK